jgi:NAD(P)-dependent dehydrogenase (short-subunit alcohol dehydrogenase family)
MKEKGSLVKKNQPMSGKICMVTGATDGIGVPTAHALADMGAHVVVIGRSREKSEKVVEKIKQETGNQAVEYMLADFSDLAQVRNLAQEFKSRHSKLHVLVNNAGVLMITRRYSVDGYEMMFAVNHLAHFLLTMLLLDTIKSSAPARIVNVSSGSHRRGELDFDDLHGRKRFHPGNFYGNSKLANVLFTYELARRLEGTGVTANVLHPGFIRTNMAANNGWFVRLVLPLVHMSSLTPEQGAKTNIYLASSPEVEGVTGKYFINCKEVRSSRASHDPESARRLWEESLKLTGLKEEAAV